MKTYTYYVYHIVGVKIGCTTELEERMSDQGFTEWEILWQEEGDYEFGWTAGDKELELQKEYGYEVDRTHYQVVRENRRRGGIIGGSVKGAKLTFTQEHKKRLSLSSKGIPKSTKHKESISIANIGNQNAVKSKSKRDMEFQQKIDAFKEWSSLLSDYNNGMSFRKLAIKYNLCRYFISKVIKKG